MLNYIGRDFSLFEWFIRRGRIIIGIFIIHISLWLDW